MRPRCGEHSPREHGVGLLRSSAAPHLAATVEPCGVAGIIAREAPDPESEDMSICARSGATVLLALLLFPGCAAEAPAPAEPWGRWDMTVTEQADTFPMWLEIRDGMPPTGVMQPRGGHALETGAPVVDGDHVTFDLTGEWEPSGLRRFDAELRGDSLIGALVRDDGSIPFTAVRAPSLTRTGVPVWGDEIDLLEDGVAGWHTRVPDRNGWRVENGELINEPPSSDLITNARFTDFMLHLETNVPPEGNSGIYLRGRYEVQVLDDAGNDPWSRGMGGIYGQVSPTTQPARPAGEWQSFDITLIGRRVTVVLNGITMIEDAEIPGITGGALDSHEGQPGPLMLQGDHGGIRYRNIRLTPAN